MLNLLKTEMDRTTTLHTARTRYSETSYEERVSSNRAMQKIGRPGIVPQGKRAGIA
jgi:hypothetical protein